MLRAVKIRTVFYLARLVWVLNKTPKFILAVFFGRWVLTLGAEPFAFELVAYFVEGLKGVFLAIFKAVITACSCQAFETIPVGFWNGVKRWRQTVHVVTTVAAVAK